jgi:hypothetical protein
METLDGSQKRKVKLLVIITGTLLSTKVIMINNEIKKMSRDSGANWGYPYYNKPKPMSYKLAQYQSRLEAIELQIKALEKEKQELISKINA